MHTYIRTILTFRILVSFVKLINCLKLTGPKGYLLFKEVRYSRVKCLFLCVYTVYMYYVCVLYGNT